MGASRQGARGATPSVGAGDHARLPRRYLRLARRRGDSTDQWQERGDILRRRGRWPARPRLLDWPSREQETRVVPITSVDLQGGDFDEQALTQNQRKLLAASREPNSLLNRPSTTGTLDSNSREYHAAEIPAGNGITDARSLARMYASLIGDGVDGVRLLSDETVARASAEQAYGRDEVLQLPTRFGLGFALHSKEISLGQPGAFGHSGAGGSLGFADPKAGIGFGYVMNKMQLVAGDDPRTLTLIAAVHESLKG